MSMIDLSAPKKKYYRPPSPSTVKRQPSPSQPPPPEVEVEVPSPITYKNFPNHPSSSTYRAKLRKLFPDLEPLIRNRLFLDDVALYSATDQRTADLMSRILLCHCSPSCTIVDATASSAGNTLSFAKHFQNVVAIEKNACRLEHLKHNAKTLGINNIKFIFADCLHVLLPDLPDSNLHVDALFIDPPWGGPSYRRNIKTSLSLSKIPLHSVVRDLASRQVARIIAIKIPNNFDMEEFMHGVGISSDQLPSPAIDVDNAVPTSNREHLNTPGSVCRLLAHHSFENMKMIVLSSERYENTQEV